MACKYCGDFVNSNGYCVRCGATYPVQSKGNNNYGGGGNAHPNSDLWKAADDIEAIMEEYRAGAAQRRQANKEYFARRDQERAARNAARDAENGARKAAKAHKQNVNKPNTSASNAKPNTSNEKSDSKIGLKLGGGLILGLLACVISPKLFVVGFIVGFIITK